MKFAIIGGSSYGQLRLPHQMQHCETPYGDVDVALCKTESGKCFAFLTRGGFTDKQDARDVNYRANLYALYLMGVTHVVSISSVGTCDYSIKLGEYCLISDFIDFTSGRENSFRREHRVVKHAGMENVFDAEMNDALEHLMDKHHIACAGRAAYACTNGPRFETAGEVRMMRMLGAQVLGMTLVPEAPLAAELGMRYASIGIIANYATGMAGDLNDDDIRMMVEAYKGRAFDLAVELIERTR